MNPALMLVYGIVSYLVFLVAFLYAIGFVGDVVVPKSINSGTPEPWAVALLVDAILLGLFAVQHSVMARPAFKRWWTKIIPQVAERSTYVLISSLILLLLYWQWRPLPEPIWQVESPAVRGLLWGLYAAGWLIVFVSTFMIDHFELFGVRQAVTYFRGHAHTPPSFKTPGFYRFVRHPLMLGFLIAFWAAPDMTAGRLLFAFATTVYILIALQLEERDLLHYFGEQYEQYKRRVPMLLPWMSKSRGP
ncbi:MAG TPA: NnrU family protein [Gemmataceae bacterium]|jgi:protein-S-isoprenylcysteine O-methyltransferase Ste14|nr:NnrU family protein [Gemmataceae bacterium]